MKRIIAHIISIFIVTQIFGQASGYLGNRTILQYDFGLNPAYADIFNSFGTDNTLTSAMGNTTLSHKANFEYVINRNWSANLIFQMYNFELNNTVNNVEVAIYDDIYNWEEYIAFHQNLQINGRFTSKAYGAGATKYFTNIAPLGSYIRFEFLYIPFSYDIDSITSTPYYAEEDIIHTASGSIWDYNSINDDYEYNTDLVLIDDKYHTYCLSAEIGKQKIYWSRFVFRYGVRFGYVFNMFSTFRSEKKATNVMYYTGNKKLILSNYVSFNFGLGILLF